MRFMHKSMQSIYLQTIINIRQEFILNIGYSYMTTFIDLKKMSQRLGKNTQIMRVCFLPIGVS